MFCFSFYDKSGETDDDTSAPVIVNEAPPPVYRYTFYVPEKWSNQLKTYLSYFVNPPGSITLREVKESSKLCCFLDLKSDLEVAQKVQQR